MLKIKDGRLYGSNYTFVLPEGFYLNPSSAIKFGSKRLELSADNGLVIIIYFRNEGFSPKETQEIIEANHNLIKIGNFISVKRGEGVGVGLYYRDEFRSTEHYEERYDFKKNRYGETQLDIDISLRMGRDNSGLTIQEVLEYPSVKAFLESVEYF